MVESSWCVSFWLLHFSFMHCLIYSHTFTHTHTHTHTTHARTCTGDALRALVAIVSRDIRFNFHRVEHGPGGCHIAVDSTSHAKMGQSVTLIGVAAEPAPSRVSWHGDELNVESVSPIMRVLLQLEQQPPDDFPRSMCLSDALTPLTAREANGGCQCMLVMGFPVEQGGTYARTMTMGMCQHLLGKLAGIPEAGQRQQAVLDVANAFHQTLSAYGMD